MCPAELSGHRKLRDSVAHENLHDSIWRKCVLNENDSFCCSMIDNNGMYIISCAGRYHCFRSVNKKHGGLIHIEKHSFVHHHKINISLLAYTHPSIHSSEYPVKTTEHQTLHLSFSTENIPPLIETGFRINFHKRVPVVKQKVTDKILPVCKTR